MKIKELINRFEKFAPKVIAEKNDPVGLQIGSLDREFTKVMTTLDVRPEVVQEAIDNNVDFIFAHHPVMFRPAQNLDLTVPQNQMYADLIKHDITVYAAHTNLDSADNGLNDWLAEQLGLSNLVGLVPGYQEPVYRLTVQVQHVYADAVRLSLVASGAQIDIDDSKSYTYASDGTVYFDAKPGEDMLVDESIDPVEVEDTRLEFEVLASNLEAVLQALHDVHPLANPLYNLIKLSHKSHQYFMGRVGELKQPMTVLELANYCKESFGVSGLRMITNHPDKLVQKVAVLGGDGGKFYHQAMALGADVYITGDAYYHTGHDILADDFTVIDPGHHIEQVCKQRLADLFTKWAQENDWQFSVYQSQLNTDPFTFI